jgi:hypothetical protein
VPQTIRLVVTVKAYPAASVKYGEVVCVAGIRTDTERPEWVRLYPVDFRDRPYDQQFGKWSEIELSVSASSDLRPESTRPDTDSIKVLRTLDTSNGWAHRRPLVEPLLVESMCEVRRRQQETGMSLAAFRPHEVRDVIVEPEPDDWTPSQLASLSKLSLFAQDKTTLEKIPWRWKYSYSCGGRCNGHAQTIIDWEAAQAWRSWRATYGPEGAAEQVRQKWLTQLASPSKDTVFFVGNQHQYPESFLALGVYWPPRLKSQDVQHLDFGR